MASARAEAERELAEKMRLERRLRRELRPVEKSVARSTIASLAASLSIPADLEAKAAELSEPVLSNHYRRVSRAFAGRVERDVPEEERLTSTERAGLAVAVAAALATRAKSSAALYGGASAREAVASVAAVRAEQDRRASAGEPALDRRSFAVAAGVTLDRRLRSMSAAAAISETNAPAELSKASEALALAGGNLERDPLSKTWVSQGDSDVRPHHLRADGQRVLASEPFRVMGELLMYPLDTSLGATAANVSNCRCSAQYSR